MRTSSTLCVRGGRACVWLVSTLRSSGVVSQQARSSACSLQRPAHPFVGCVPHVLQMALRLRVASACSCGSPHATDAHAPRTHSPQLLFPYQPSSPRSHATGHLRINSLDYLGWFGWCGLALCELSLIATFGSGGAPLGVQGEDEQGLVSDFGQGGPHVKVTLQLWNIA